jgi:2-aminoethylphosphonate-pyruvate transaminase
MTTPGWKDKALFTPGPLSTSRTVKQAMLRDLGSRDDEFVEVVRDVRRRLVTLTGADPSRYTAILMQGSGTFGIEAVIGSAVLRQGRLAVLINGAYGERMARIARALSIESAELASCENRPVDPDEVDALLAKDERVTHVAVVHCETTTGLMNPVEEIGAVVARHERALIVDAMSSFGACPIALGGWGIDYLISSANKCIEGVPGFSFVLARKEALLSSRGHARSVSLDLLAQYEGLEQDGQFRFTPPTHVILAFHQALLELEQEGGVAGRAERYRRNHRLTLEGMSALGFQAYLEPELQGYIITSFRYPKHPGFDFPTFYRLLSDRGQIIYPGKLTHADCFRIGHIGRLDAGDVQGLLNAVRDVMAEMNITL